MFVMKTYIVPSVEVMKFQADALMDMISASVPVGGDSETADPATGQLTNQQGWSSENWED